MSDVRATQDADAGRPNRAARAPLPNWVLWCWPTSWRRSYGDEMADTWADCGGTRRGQVRLAGQGLWQRLVRPHTAAEVADREVEAGVINSGDVTAGRDLALIAAPRMLLRTLVAMATVVVLMAVTFLPLLVTAVPMVYPALAYHGPELTWSTEGSGDLWRYLAGGTFLMATVLGVWAARRGTTRDQGLGVLLGGAAVVATPFCGALLDRSIR